MYERKMGTIVIVPTIIIQNKFAKIANIVSHTVKNISLLRVQECKMSIDEDLSGCQLRVKREVL